MGLTHKDIGATTATALATLVFAANAGGWDVALVGSSRRWAAAAILLLGMAGCALGSAPKPPDGPTKALAALGVVSAVAGVLALLTGSLAALEALVLCLLGLWLGSTMRHASEGLRAAGKS